jgi:hypothetical protein
VKELAPHNYNEVQVLSKLPKWKGVRVENCCFNPEVRREALIKSHPRCLVSTIVDKLNTKMEMMKTKISSIERLLLQLVEKRGH